MQNSIDQVSENGSSENRRSENRVAALSPAKRTALFAVVLLILTLILVAIAELGIRTRMYVKYGTFMGFEIKALDAETGLRLPKANYVSGPVRINSLGFRSPELVSPKADNTVRMAFLGGSTTFCQEVSSNDMVWPAILTSELNQSNATQNFEHINASVTGFTLQKSLINLKHRVAGHQPDIVFIYHATNDISFNARMLASKNSGQSQLSQETSPWLQKLLDVSLMAELIDKNIKVKRNQSQASNSSQKTEYDEEFMVSQFREDLGNLVTEALRTAKLVVIPTFASQMRHDQTPEQQLEAANTALFYTPHFRIEELVQAFTSYNEVIREFADMEGVVVIETESAIQGTRENFFDSVHFTDTGSMRLGQHLAQELGQSSKFQALFSN